LAQGTGPSLGVTFFSHRKANNMGIQDALLGTISDAMVANATNATNATIQSCIEAAQNRATNLDDLWHPYILLYTGHCLAAAVGFVLSLQAPGCYAAVMVLSGLSFLYSAITGAGMWNHLPGSYLWTGVFIKWIIVNIGATVPVLLLRSCKLSRTAIQATAVGIYVILGSNIIWTLGHDSQGHIVVYLNRTCGVALVIALLVHCVAVCVRGKRDVRSREAPLLFEVAQRFPYGFGTSMPWLVCYTVWNALFIAKITIGGLLQDILFWVLMVAYQNWDIRADGVKLPLELYFGYARPVQLGTYIAFTEFVGTFVPYFYEATELTEEQPLPVNSHAFFLFIAFVNMLWSFVVVFWAFQRLFCGLDFFKKSFKDVHALQGDESDSEKDDLDSNSGEE